MSNSGDDQDRILKLIRIHCRWCGAEFYVCQSCWRGQSYCRDACRMAGRRRSHRNAQKRYRQTQKGRKAHRLAENRRRSRKIKLLSKKMDDATSRSRFVRGMKTSKPGVFHHGIEIRCHLCGQPGKIVNRFPRRGYA